MKLINHIFCTKTHKNNVLYYHVDEKMSTKELCPALLNRLLTNAHSQMRSHYCCTRGLLPAGFPPWAGSSLLRRPGHLEFLQDHHIDAKLSADI